MCQIGLVVNNGKLTYFDNIDDGIKFYNEINKKAK
jgi:hypothetical protein